MYFNSLAILFNTSASVVVLWLATMLVRTNKRKWSWKKWRNQAKINAIAEDFFFNKFVKFTICLYSRLPSWPFFPNKKHTQTFLTLQSKWAREEKLCLYSDSAFRGWNSTKFWIIVMQIPSLFIHITSFLRTSTTPVETSTSNYYLKSWYFQIIQCPPSSKWYLFWII